MRITLRKATDDDLAFVKSLFLDFKAGQLNFSDASISLFRSILETQYTAQVRYYSGFGDEFLHWIILSGNERIGRYIEVVDGDNLHMADMIILPEHRNRGVAGKILKRRIDSGKRKYSSITCRVDKAHTIIAFYKRLGFEIIQDEGMEYLMALKM